MPDLAPDDLIRRTLAGERVPLARALSWVENEHPNATALLDACFEKTGRAYRLGVTGPPGAGKSTLVTKLALEYRARGETVAVVAVDPTSPFSGGALLGDRVRMHELSGDEGVFIRSMASRGQLGGLAWATPQALRILDAAGFGLVLIETVGVGQAELEIASLADTTLVIVAPGMGDSIQAAKAGILEIADVFVVNKSDRPGAQEVVRDLRTMLSMGEWPPGRWKPPIVSTAAAASDRAGLDDLVERIGQHQAWLDSSGELAARRQTRAREEIAAIAVAVLRERMGALPGDQRIAELAARVAAGETDPYTAADELVSG